MSCLIKFRFYVSIVIAILPVAFAVVSCDENNLQNGENPLLRPSIANYDSVYNEIAQLYVVQDDTMKYNLKNYYSELSTEESNINNRLNDYSSEMLKTYADINKKENTILSPISAIMMYSMMANFSADDKENIFKEVMHIDDYNMNDINSYSRKVINQEEKRSRYLKSGNDYRISNNIWMRKDMTIYQSYLSMANFFDTRVKGVDMSDANSFKEINDEIKTQVGSHLSSAGSDISPTTDIGIDRESLSSVNSIVTSSLSFRQEWTHKFETESTEKDFKNADGSVTQSKMLKMLTKRFGFCKNFCMGEISYEDDDFSMYILLPETGVSVNKCLSSLQEEGMQKCLSQLKDPLENTYVYMSIPQVKFRTTTALNRSSGMINKDVSKMYSINLPKVSPNGFSLNNIYQSCSIDINESGTNATSNAKVLLSNKLTYNSSPGGSLYGGNDGSVDEKKSIIWTVNRPFIILIRNNKLGFILFACCINNISD